MKLVIATPLYPPEIGGPAQYAYQLVQALTAGGHEIVLVKFSDVRRYPVVVRHVRYFCKVFFALRGAQAVLVFDTWSTGIPALSAALLRGKKSLVRIGGDFLWETYVGRTGTLVRLSDFYKSSQGLSLKERIISIGTRWFTKHADALVFNTEWQKELWKNAYHIHAQKLFVVENEYSNERDFSLARGRVFVAAGRSHPLKNEKVLRSIFMELQQEFNDIVLDTRTFPLEAHRARIRDAYAVIIPSVSEISPNTAFDAIRYGKPFVMPKDSGAYSLFKDVGLCIDTLDKEALKEAIRSLLDPRVYEGTQARVRSFSYTRTWRDVTEEFYMILKQLCAS